MIAATDENYDEVVLDSKIPVVVDFWAKWCGPCKPVKAALEDISRAYDGRVLFVGVDVEEATEVAEDYEIRSIPTILGIKDGEVELEIHGLQDHKSLIAFIEELLKVDAGV